MNSIYKSAAAVHIVRLEGRLDANRVLNDSESLALAIPDSANNLLLNLHEVTFIDSSGLGYLVSIYRKCESENRRMSICEPTDQARMLFELTRMHQIFSIYDSESAALSLAS